MGKVLKKRLRQESFPSVEDEVVLNLLVTSNYLRNDLNRLCEERGLTRGQFNVLRILEGVYPEGHARYDISQRMAEPAPDVTRLLDRLVGNDFVERYQCPEDGRKSIAKITDKGREKVKDLDDIITQTTNYIASCLTKKECKKLSELCEKLYEDKVE